jgi:hypothetical protein
MIDADEIGAIDTGSWREYPDDARQLGQAWFNDALTWLQRDATPSPTLLPMADRLVLDVAATLAREEDSGDMAAFANQYETIRHRLSEHSWAPPITAAVPLFRDSGRTPSTADPDTVARVIAALQASNLPRNHPLLDQAVRFQQWWHEQRDVATPLRAQFPVTLSHTVPGLVRIRAERMAGWLLAQVPRVASAPTPAPMREPGAQPTPEYRESIAPTSAAAEGGDGWVWLLAAWAAFKAMKKGR